ncbi:GlxA family transcriptional regulator [Jiangella asiatica]|uniref:GlxA family transcriptional regulator n=1 Tax=Jiangella asiatica TaxID=2530372 RepID=A0A4R5D9B0_9ACTN|nr:GlxA family transcriptional regulator [Jiangella asiatica]TDE10126.1 GlxA family transcriptional regulator [Jiangella asiatica]
MHTRTVAVLGYNGAQVIDATGPAEVFAIANELAGGRLYRVVLASVDGRDVVGASGLRLGVELPLGDIADTVGPLDTVVVPGTYRWTVAAGQTGLLDALRGAAASSRRVAAVCAGAFLLGRIGLLDGRRATTHWMLLDELAERFPATKVERGPIFVADGAVFTSAGVTAGIDLALALVEADHGPVLARQVARFMVVFMQRPGGQRQFSVRLRSEITKPVLRGLLDAISADPAGDHRLSALSSRAGFSERHLSRLFARELGTTPARYVEQVRVEAARALLETSDAPLDVIARLSGLSSAETLRRSFTRDAGVTPHAYRQRFRSTGATTG